MHQPLSTPGAYEGVVDFSTHIVLQLTEDAAEFAVLRDAIKMSGLIKDMLDEGCEVGEKVVPLPNVTSKVIPYVLDYCTFHWNNPAAPIPKPLKKGGVRTEICDWDRDFLFTDLVKGGVEKEHALLIECIKAANFLHIEPLLLLTCATVADMILGKTPDEIRALFDIVDDITPEEHEEMKKHNRWCDDS